MNVLAFDTSTKIFSLCLDTNKNHFEFSCSLGYKHSETLVTEIDKFLNRSGIQATDLDLIVCSAGPGSFTGLRIAMATAKGISLGSGTPMITIPTLDMMAYGLEYFDGIVVPVIDARKERYYAAFFDKGNKISDNLDLFPKDLLFRLKNYNKVLLTGPDAAQFSELFKLSNNISFDPLKIKAWAANLIPLGIEKYQTSGASDDNEGPLYLRKSEAEIGITRKSQ